MAYNPVVRSRAEHHAKLDKIVAAANAALDGREIFHIRAVRLGDEVVIQKSDPEDRYRIVDSVNTIDRSESRD